MNKPFKFNGFVFDNYAHFKSVADEASNVGVVSMVDFENYLIDKGV
jgi:hypothetical protein